MRRRFLRLLPPALAGAAAFLFLTGLLAQLLSAFRLWRAAGADPAVPPALPSLRASDVFRAVFVFPDGLLAAALVLIPAGIYVLALRRGGPGENEDRDRNLTVSGSGSFGTAGFLTLREAKRFLEISESGRTDRDILGMLPDGRVLTLPEGSRLNENLAVCGASGTGKSRSVSRNLILQAAKRGESVIVTDPKSELYETMSGYLREQGYEVRVLNLVEMDCSDAWNCLAEVGGSEQMAQVLTDVVMSNTGGSGKDPFWYHAEANLLKALVLYTTLEQPPERRNLGTVCDLLGSMRETGMNAEMERIRRPHRDLFTGKDLPPSPAAAPWSLFLQSSDAVRGGVIIGLGSRLQVLQSRPVREITSRSEIDLELPGKKKCAYFCIVSDQDSAFDFLSSLFFSFLFIRLIRYADPRCPGGVLPVKVRFILDEFPNCCLIPDFTKKCSTIRSRGCSVAVFFQNVGQMKDRYPGDRWQEILGACDATIFLGCTDLLTARYISERSGEATVEVESASRGDGSERKTRSVGRRPLLTPDEVLRLLPDEELIFLRGRKVLRARRFDYSLHPAYPALTPARSADHVPLWREQRGAEEGTDGGGTEGPARIPAPEAEAPAPPPAPRLRKLESLSDIYR